MVVSKHLTHFCYPIRLVLHQHLNSLVAYPGIPPENSNHMQGQYQHLPSYPLLRLLDQNLKITLEITLTLKTLQIICEKYANRCML